MMKSFGFIAWDGGLKIPLCGPKLTDIKDSPQNHRDGDKGKERLPASQGPAGRKIPKGPRGRDGEEEYNHKNPPIFCVKGESRGIFLLPAEGGAALL